MKDEKTMDDWGHEWIYSNTSEGQVTMLLATAGIKSIKGGTTVVSHCREDDLIDYVTVWLTKNYNWLIDKGLQLTKN